MNTGQIIFAIATGLLANELFDISPWLGKRIVRWAAGRAYPDPSRAVLRAEEWCAVIDERPGKLLKLTTAAWLAVGAIASTTRSRSAERLGALVLRAGETVASIAEWGSRFPILYEAVLRLAVRLGSTSAQLMLAWFFEVTGRDRAAIAVYEDLAKNKMPEVWLRLVGLLEAVNDFDSAVLVCRRALETGPEKCYAKAELLNLLERLNRFDEAMELYHLKVESEPVSISDLRFTYAPTQLSFQPFVRPVPTADWAARLALGGRLELENRMHEAAMVYRGDGLISDPQLLSRLERMIRNGAYGIGI